jgi:AcrR family transcriptional regulator
MHAMCAAYGPDDRPPEDLTARARIRDAALDQFARHGIKGATIRGIAEAAGVSAGLVRHHFGSKEGLRRACDQAVLDLFRRRLVQASIDGDVTPDLLASVYGAGVPMLRYLARAAAEGSAVAGELLDEMAAGNEEFLSATWPERFPPGSQAARDAATIMSAMNGGTVVLHEYVARRMGLVPWTDIDSPRIGTAMFQVYIALGELLSSAAGGQLADALATYHERAARGARATPGDPDAVDNRSGDSGRATETTRSARGQRDG